MTWSRTWPCWRTSTRRPCYTTCGDATRPGWSMWVHRHGALWEAEMAIPTECGFLRPTPGCSVWRWIHTNGCQSTQPPWLLPTRANAAPKRHRTSTPSQIMHTMTCCEVGALKLHISAWGLQRLNSYSSFYLCYSLLRSWESVYAHHVSLSCMKFFTFGGK